MSDHTSNNVHIKNLIDQVKGGEITRRQFVLRGIALGLSLSTIGVLLSSCGTEQAPAATQAPSGGTTPAAGKPAGGKDTPLNILGIAIALQEPFLKKFTEETGYKVVPTMTTLSGLMTKMLSGGVNQYDVIDENASYIQPIWDGGVLQPIPVDKIPNFKNLIPLFTDPKAEGNVDGWPANIIWTDDKKTHIKGLPLFWNFEGFGFLKDVATDLNSDSSYGALLDPKYKGKVAIWNDSVWTTGWVGLYMQKNEGLQLSKSATNMTQPEIDKVFEFLTKKKKDGQFRLYWSDYGEIVNLMTAKEVWLADCWNPVVNDVTKAGTPAQYVNPKEGSRPWFHFLGISRECKNLEAAYAYANWCISGWRGAQVAALGWYDASAKVKDFLDPKEYKFWYEGGGRDTGSMELRLKNVAFWPRWPDEADYQLSKWLNFLAT